jgi:hypothetical protein
MRREYPCFIAGLPELFPDAKKIDFILINFREQLREVLHYDDFRLIEPLFWKYDNTNIIRLLKDPKSELDGLGNLSGEDIEEIFYLVKDDALSEYRRKIPPYFEKFINAYQNDVPLFKGKGWENQITQLFYDFAVNIDNHFVRSWFEFEMNLTNILTAASCRKYKMDIENELIGNNEITEKLIKSSARDFGISSEFPMLESIIRATEENNIIEKERKIDMVMWDLLNERTFFHYFTIEKIFAYTIQVGIIERWLKMDKDKGNELFNDLLARLENSYEFPKEYTIY